MNTKTKFLILSIAFLFTNVAKQPFAVPISQEDATHANTLKKYFCSIGSWLCKGSNKRERAEAIAKLMLADHISRQDQAILNADKAITEAEQLLVSLRQEEFLPQCTYNSQSVDIGHENNSHILIKEENKGYFSKETKIILYGVLLVSSYCAIKQLYKKYKDINAKKEDSQKNNDKKLKLNIPPFKLKNEEF